DKLRVFNPFVQGDSSATRKYMGTGLGLSISRQLAELMGGKIDIESKKGRGTKLVFDIILESRGEEPLISGREPMVEKNVFHFLEENLKARVNLEAQLQMFNFRGVIYSGLRDFTERFTPSTQEFETNSVHYIFIDRGHWSEDSSRHYLTNLRKNLDGVRAKIRIVILMDFSDTNSSASHELGSGVDFWMVRPIYPWQFHRNLLELVGDGTAFKSIKKAQDVKESNYRLEGRTLLLVEDNEVNQLVARDILEKAGASVVLAENGKVALKLLEDSSNAINAVLLDLQMPVMDGYATITKLRDNPHWSKLPVIAMTAHALPEERSRCLVLGMNDYLTKPVEPELMVKTISRWLNPLSEDASTKMGARTIDLQGSIDWALALKNAGGNQHLLSEVALKFNKDYGSSSGLIRTLLREGKLVQAQRLLLSLKAVAGYLGAIDLRRASEELENQLRLAQVEGMNEAWVVFDHHLRSVSFEILSYLNEMHPGVVR
ncbi:MAG: putative hybrid sensory kinase, partial [Pseudomonadota bacterium]